MIPLLVVGVDREPRVGRCPHPMDLTVDFRDPMETFLIERERNLQSKTVAYRSQASTTRCRYFWTKRMTTSDIMSVVRKHGK